MAVTINNQTALYANVKDTFPQSESLTGTASTMSRKDRLIGSGTAFVSELETGDFIWDTVNDELLKVVSIESDTELTLSGEFSNALSGATIKRVPRIRYQSFSYLIDSSSGEEIDGILMPDGASATFAISDHYSNMGNPIIIDSTVNDGNVIISFFA
jgi:hypothetical protein